MRSRRGGGSRKSNDLVGRKEKERERRRKARGDVEEE